MRPSHVCPMGRCVRVVKGLDVLPDTKALLYDDAVMVVVEVAMAVEAVGMPLATPTHPPQQGS